MVTGQQTSSQHQWVTPDGVKNQQKSAKIMRLVAYQAR